MRAVEPTAGGAVLWRYRGGVVLTAIAKLNLAWVPDGPMRPVAGAELHLADRHVGDDVRRGLVASSDLAPHRSKADVVITGHAVVAGAGLLRVALSGDRVVLDKTISVVDHGPASMQGPARVPIAYEEALGGPSRDDNPAGTTSPRLLDPSNPARVACFAPIPQSWPARNRLLGGLDRRAIDGVRLDVPAAIDWSFFQAAPPDQRVDFLSGDEWLLLSGFTAGQPVLRTRLPSLVGVAELRGHGAPSQSIDLRVDTLHVDLDRRECSVVLRGKASLPATVSASNLDLSVRIDARRPAWSAGAPARSPTPAPGHLDKHTVEFRLDAMLAGPGAALPFAPTAASAPARPAAEIAGAPWAAAAATPAPKVTPGLKATFGLAGLPSSAREVVQRLAPLPDAPAPPALVTAPAAPALVASPPAMKSEPPPRRSDRPAPPPAVVAEAPPPPKVEPPPPKVEQPPAPRIVAAEPPPAPPPSRDASAVYTTASPEKPMRVAPPPPAPPRRESAASEAVRGSVYGRFGPLRK
ncbi:MAG TPA: DUF2169 domain-containing protein [Byssovorax sp.]